MMKQFRSVTLIEVLIVVLIIGVMAALSLPNFGRMRERGLDREVRANLKLIQAAERIYRMEIGDYYPYGGGSQSNITTINSYLKLSLPAETNWDYSVTTSAGSLDARSTRDNNPPAWDREFAINETRDEACCVYGPCAPGTPSCPAGP